MQIYGMIIIVCAEKLRVLPLCCERTDLQEKATFQAKNVNKGMYILREECFRQGRVKELLGIEIFASFNLVNFDSAHVKFGLVYTFKLINMQMPKVEVEFCYHIDNRYAKQ
jgi:hypothetical protein